MGQPVEDDVKKLKSRLRQYTREDIRFNEPHFTTKLWLRDGSKKEVIANLLNPDKLVYSYHTRTSRGRVKHVLHFEMSNTRTMILPAIFSKKHLYILTYIMGYRRWQSMIKKRRRK